MTARILTIHRANVEIDGRLYGFIRKTCSRTEPPSGAEPGVMLAKDVAPGSILGASATPIGSRERSRQGASPPSGLRSSRGAR